MPVKQSIQPYSQFHQPENISIAIIGLGYVGLPLAVEFAKKYVVKGFDITQSRIDELNNNYDRTFGIDENSLITVRSTKPGLQGLTFTSAINDIALCNVYIVSVPTPTDQYNRPDLICCAMQVKQLAHYLKQVTW